MRKHKCLIPWRQKVELLKRSITTGFLLPVLTVKTNLPLTGLRGRRIAESLGGQAWR
jgi:hypothetical protein